MSCCVVAYETASKMWEKRFAIREDIIIAYWRVQIGARSEKAPFGAFEVLVLLYRRVQKRLEGLDIG